MLRPDVVWFGEPLDQDVWQSAISHACRCDVMIVAGTSLVVQPANTLPVHARLNGATLIEINPERTAMSDYMDHVIRGTAAASLPRLLERLRPGP